MTEDAVADNRAVKHTLEAFYAPLILVLVLSVGAFAATNRFAIGPGYWDYWPIFLPTALLAIPALTFAYLLIRGVLHNRTGWLLLGAVSAINAVLLGWWIFLFIQPMILHLTTKSSAEFDLVSQGTYSRDRVGSWRYRRDGCPEVLALNDQLGEFSYCVPEGDLYFANIGNVVTLRVDVSPFGTWISGPPQLKVNAAVEAVEAAEAAERTSNKQQ